MEVIAFCVKCREMKEMLNPRIEDSKRGKKYKGQCACGTNMSATVPKSAYQEAPQEVPQNPEIIKERQEFKDFPKEIPPIEKLERQEEERLERERLEKEATDKFIREAKEDTILKKNGVKVVREGYYKLLKAIVIIFAVAILIFAYLSYNDYYSSSMMCGNLSCPDCPACPESPCNCNPTSNCNPELVCSNISCPKCPKCEFPSNLNINLTG